MIDYLATIKKALVPVAVGVVLTLLGYVGITGEMTVKEAVTLLVTAVMTWAVRNTAKK